VNGRVVLEVPAKPEYLLLARLAVTSVGRSAGASEETIADLKLAVTEAVTRLVPGGNGSADQMARLLHRSLHDKLLSLPDHVLLYPAHYSGSVCGRGLSANPASTVGFERLNNPLLALDEDDFVAALMKDLPPAPADQAAIVAANRSGAPAAATR